MTPARTICIGFLVLIAIGTLLLSLPWAVVPTAVNTPLTALFMATSAVCVTGLAVVDVSSHYTLFGQVVLLMLFQIGGLGYMTANTFLLLLIGRKFSLKEKLTLQQSLDLRGLQGSATVVRSIIATTLLFELGGTVLLTPVFSDPYGWERGWWLALFHSVSAFNNAGFSLFSNSLMDYVHHPWINLVVSGLIIAGGIGYQVLAEMYVCLRAVCRRQSNDPKINFSLNFKVVTTTTIVLLGMGTGVLFLSELATPQMQALSWAEQIWASWFQAVTARTAGFNTIDIGKMSTTGLFTMTILMFIGASPGGTGGGIKTTTVRILACCTNAALHGREAVWLYQRQVPTSLILKAVAVGLGSLSVVLLSTIILSMSETQVDFIQLLFEATSAFATVGLSTGITPQLSGLGQLVLIGSMYVGRVGVLLLIGAMSGNPRPSLVKFPEEYMLVG